MEEAKLARRRKNQEKMKADAARRAAAETIRGTKASGKGRTFSFVLVVAVLLIYAGGYMFIHARDLFTPNTLTETLRLSSVEQQLSIGGIIIRDEQVFYADRDGRVVFNVGDFERVRANMLVASVQDSDAMAGIQQESADVEAMIRRVQDMRHSTITAPQVEMADANLRNMITGNMHHFTTGNISGINDLFNNLYDVSSRRNQLILSENRDARVELGRMYDNLQLQRRLNSSEIYATRSGIMSPIIDGAENIFNLDNMRTLTREQVRFTIDPNTIVPSRYVQAGDPVFKIVGNVWYIATYIPNEMIHGWAAGDQRIVYVNNSGIYEAMMMRVEQVTYGARGDSFVLLRSTRGGIDFLHQRNVSLRVVDNVTRGFTISSSAVATRSYFRLPISHIHGSLDPYVLLRTDYGLRSVPITIREMTDTHANIDAETSGLMPGDTIAPVEIFGPDLTITHADILQVHGVYRSTLGVAEFRRINVDEGQLDAGATILLDPARNREIREFDTIITDASTIREGEVVRRER